MSVSVTFTNDEVDGLLNALNYFAHGIGADECHTLIGLEQADVKDLYERVRDEKRSQSSGKQ